MKKLLWVFATAALLWAIEVRAATITYVINDPIGLSGTITTDGTIGTLSAGNIQNWNLTLSGTYTLTDTDATAYKIVTGTALTADATNLFFNYSGSGVFELGNGPPPSPPSAHGGGSGFPYGMAEWGYFPTSFGSNLLLYDNFGSCPPDCLSITGGRNENLAISSGVSSGVTPLPAALPLFATGAGVIGLLGWRRKRKAAALAA